MAELKGPMPKSRPFLDAFDLKAGVDIQVLFFWIDSKEKHPGFIKKVVSF